MLPIEGVVCLFKEKMSRFSIYLFSVNNIRSSSPVRTGKIHPDYQIDA